MTEYEKLAYEQGIKIRNELFDWYIHNNKYRNEQWYLNLLDDINKISVDNIVDLLFISKSQLFINEN
jgi:hypothetical protein